MASNEREAVLKQLYNTMENVFGKAVETSNDRFEHIYSFVYNGVFDALVNDFKNEFKQIKPVLKSAGFIVTPPTNKRRGGDEGTRLMSVKDESGVVCEILAHRPSPISPNYSLYNGNFKVSLVVDNKYSIILDESRRTANVRGRLNEMAAKRIGGKQTIEFEKAEQMLFDKLNKLDIGDDVYELVNNIFHRFVDEIEDQYTIVDDGGNVIDSSSNEDEMWYDNVDEDFRDSCYAKLKSFL